MHTAGCLNYLVLIAPTGADELLGFAPVPGFPGRAPAPISPQTLQR